MQNRNLFRNVMYTALSAVLIAGAAHIFGPQAVAPKPERKSNVVMVSNTRDAQQASYTAVPSAVPTAAFVSGRFPYLGAYKGINNTLYKDMRLDEFVKAEIQRQGSPLTIEQVLALFYSENPSWNPGNETKKEGNCLNDVGFGLNVTRSDCSQGTYAYKDALERNVELAIAHLTREYQAFGSIETAAAAYTLGPEAAKLLPQGWFNGTDAEKLQALKNAVKPYASLYRDGMGKADAVLKYVNAISKRANCFPGAETKYETPNKSLRPGGVDYIILHHTTREKGVREEGTITWFAKPNNVSTNYLIGDQVITIAGEQYANIICFADDRYAPVGAYINEGDHRGLDRVAVEVEIANNGLGEPLTVAQMRTLYLLVAYEMAKFNVSPERVIGHPPSSSTPGNISDKSTKGDEPAGIAPYYGLSPYKEWDKLRYELQLIPDPYKFRMM